MRTAPQPEWMAWLRPGDVLRQGTSGPLRVVRTVTRRQNGRLLAITFAIRRRSWTNRAYTCLHWGDLKTMGYAPVGARVKLDGPLDRKLHEAITNNEFPWEVYRDRQYTMVASEAIGIP